MFLTFLFLLFFSLLGVTFEHVRVQSSKGYVRMSAHSAAMTVFGNYNKELYEDYGFFAYGGCDGEGIEDLASEFLVILKENMRSVPVGTEKTYGNMYRLQEIEVSLKDVEMVTKSKVFLEQIEAFLKSEAIQDLTDELLGKRSDTSGEGAIRDKLNLTKEYEEGKFNSSEETGEIRGSIETGTVRIRKGAGKEDEAEGNPLKSFVKMMKNGMLNLVCGNSALSEGVIEADDVPEDSNTKKKSKNSAADHLRDILGEENQDNETQSATQAGMNRVKYICYANRQFSSYTEDMGRTTRYGREYLIAGKREERENLSYVVNKLLRVRLLLNFASIVTDTGLQEKSLVTATVLAGFTGMPPVIRAVQYTILLILAFEEACVDVTALLDGKKVPVIKTAKNRKMQYEEICFASRALFLSKAREYTGGKKTSAAEITYSQYLWLFLLEQSERDLHKRSLDLIQYDLREKYNQTFMINTCICSGTYLIGYHVPLLLERLPFLSGEGTGADRELEVSYGYKSG